MAENPFEPLGGGPPATTTRAAPAWVNVAPVPPDAPSPPEAHPDLGKPSGRWHYLDAEGRLLGLACRFDKADGAKEFRPLTLWRPAAGNRLRWRWEAWPAPRPIYGLDRLAARPKAPVVVTEGEKSADAAGRLLPGHVAVTSPNGSKSAAKADWSPLAGRRVTIWPDADPPGAGYAEEVARLVREVGAAFVAVLAPPASAADGWDAADAEAEGWTTARAEALVATARRFEPTPSEKIVDLSAARRARKTDRAAGSSEGAGDGPHRRPRASEGLISLADEAQFWVDEDDIAFATFFDRGAWQTHQVASKIFQRFLVKQAILRDGLSPASNVLEELGRHFEGMAGLSGIVRRPALRVGELDGRYYIDLVNDQWQVVEIDKEGWRVLDRSPVPFIRKRSMRALPTPEAGSEINEIRRFVRFHDEDDFVLFCMWMVAALLPIGPYPILIFGGEQGVGKSVITTLARSLVDPNRVPLRLPPKEDSDLFVSAQNNHLLAFDNMSAMPAWLAEALCVIATDGGWATRQKFTDDEENVMKACRPTIANGISTLTDRPDFGSRAITIRLDRIPDAERKSLKAFWREWDVVCPRVFGCLLDAISTGLQRIGGVSEGDRGRLADFEMFSEAAEVGLGFEPGTFGAAYRRNKEDLAEATYEADIVASAIGDFVRSEYPNGWCDTASALLEALNRRASEPTRRLKTWPQTAMGLGHKIDRIAPVLRAQGINTEKTKQGGRRVISILPVSS